MGDAVPGSDDLGLAWIVFASIGDSVSAVVTVDSTPPLDHALVGIALERSVTGGGWFERLPGTHELAPYVHARFSQSGAYRLDIGISGTNATTVPYTLAIRRSGRSGSLQPTGKRASLQLVGDTAATFALIPNSVSADSNGDLTSWGVKPSSPANGRYAVLLVADSLYRVCRLPCRVSKMIVLEPGATARWSP